MENGENDVDALLHHAVAFKAEQTLSTHGGEGGTAIFCMYSDSENPFQNLSGVEEDLYYLQSGEAGGYVAEIDGENAAWLLKAEEGTKLVDITYQEGAMDPAERLTLEMIPFSQYK